MLWVLICTVHLTVYSYHVTYAFQSESTLWNECRVWSVDSIECGFTLERVRGMIRTYSQMHRTDKYSQHSSVIWQVWLNGWVFVYELSGCEFESSYSHWNFRFRACFQQGVLWHSGNYGVWIHYEMHMWHDKNIQSVKYRFLYLRIYWPQIFGAAKAFVDIFWKQKRWITSIIALFCVKSVCIWNFSVPYFPAFGLNTDTFHAVLVFVFTLHCQAL